MSRLRNRLFAAGIELHDTPEGTTGRSVISEPFARASSPEPPRLRTRHASPKTENRSKSTTTARTFPHGGLT